MEPVGLFVSAELVPGSLLDSALETVHTSYGSPIGLDYHLLESPPLVFLALAPEQLSAEGIFPLAAISTEPAGELNVSLESQLEYDDYTTIDYVTGCPVQVDCLLFWESTPSPLADQSIADPGDQLYIKPSWLKPVWIGNVLDDCSENIQLEISDASENPEGLQALDASSNEIWLDDAHLESSAFQEETGLSDNQNDSESAYAQTDEPLVADIDCTPIFTEYDAELSPFICYAYAYNYSPQLIFEIDPTPGVSDTPEATAISYDYSVIYPGLIDDSPAPLTGENPDSLDYFAEVLPWNESGKEPEIVICEPQIFPVWQLILPAKDSSGNEWSKIPEIANCFLPHSDTSELVPQPYDVSTIDVVNEKVDVDGDGDGVGDGDVAIIQDQDSTDASTPSRSGTTTPLPWWRGYAAAPPENLSSQLFVPEGLVENSDQDQPSPGSILDSDIPILPVAISVAALAESEVTAVAAIRNPNPAPKDAPQSDMFLQLYRYTAYNFAFETTGPAASSPVESQLFIDETTSADTDLQSQSKNSGYIVDLMLSFDSMRSGEFASPLLWFGSTRLTNLLNLPPWLAF